ncbi:IPT/TIG domain-containing protein [Mucilaginibacter gilvus]|uniref:IPT/TIG domain-containing protein n=1 Tax=Mucilaginibacter gilvus TaxID=2305909 RepID=A0A3S3V4R9_9SPHI|nr:IPT/TIG domain-containing protein [Mucilaginibacter gilvus]RWY55642.1 hypothetical protein EPL05_04510 [Mucilaginibacter gilvus]
MRTHLKTLSKTLTLMLLLILAVSSCKKDKKVDPTPTASSSMTGTIDGKTIKLDAGALTSTYYSTDGDASKALETSATLNASGDKLNFFLNDLKSGILALTKKSGTSFNPGSHTIKIYADSPSPVQSYVSYFSGGNTYFAYSGSIEITITNTSITVKWSINFKDAAGREFNSAGSFTFVNFLNVTKPKSEVKDPTPVAAKPTIENISPTSGKAGDSVSITGVNYSTIASENEVKFNGVATTVKSATATRIIVTAPQNGTTGAVTLKVKNSDLTTGPTFTYIQPATLTSISPATGKVGDTVIITGTNFSTDPGQNSVKFTGVQGSLTAVVKSATTTKLVVTVPQGALTGPITVSVRSGATLTSSEYVVIIPQTNGDWQETGFMPLIQNINLSASIGKTMLFTGGLAPNYLYYTSNGTSYANVYNNLPFDLQSLQIHLVASDGSTYYITTNQGIAKSANGTTWTKLLPDANLPNQGFTGMVTRAGVLAIMNATKLFTSTDKGDTWATVELQIPQGASLDYLTSDANGKYFYAIDIAHNLPDSLAKHVIYRSTNQGKTWNATNGTTGIYAYAGGYQDFFKSSDNYQFALFSPPSNNTLNALRLYRSTGQGEAWVKISDEQSFTVKTFGTVVTYGGTSFNISVDQGTTFAKQTIPSGYVIGGIQRTEDFYYIFCFNTSGSHRIFRRGI